MPPPPVSAQNSDAGIDTDSVTSLEGTVTEFSWRNPHIYLSMESTDSRGEPVTWELQMGSTLTSSREGWTRDSLAPGDWVTVSVHPAQNGRPYGTLESLEKKGGAVIGEELFTPEVTVSTTTLEGIWMAKSPELVSYPGGFDGFFRAQLALTEKGIAAQAAYDEFSDENPEANCIGRPTPGMIVSSFLLPMQIEFNEDADIVMIRSEFWDEERTVFMDGRPHPGDERFASGHSIGWWDEGTLVVDTASFSDHRSPYQMGVPSGAQKHVVERYRLNDEGTRIVVEFVLEDTEYIAEPLSHSRELIYSPQMEISKFDCDPEATRRFLSQ